MQYLSSVKKVNSSDIYSHMENVVKKVINSNNYKLKGSSSLITLANHLVGFSKFRDNMEECYKNNEITKAHLSDLKKAARNLLKLLKPKKHSRIEAVLFSQIMTANPNFHDHAGQKVLLTELNGSISICERIIAIKFEEAKRNNFIHLLCYTRRRGLPKKFTKTQLPDLKNALLNELKPISKHKKPTAINVLITDLLSEIDIHFDPQTIGTILSGY